MNISINKQFITEVLGHSVLDTFLTISYVSEKLLKYPLPFLATIVIVINLVVCSLCLAIYTKTRKQNHKPPFVFIGFLAFMDLLIGM